MTAKELVREHVFANVNPLVEMISYEDLCNKCECDGDPYADYFDPLEFYMVSEWLGNRLAEQGEVVFWPNDYQPMWARQTSGQAIFLDGVIEKIAKEIQW